MNDIVVFSFNERTVRTLTENGETLFRASDVAKILGVQTNGLLARIPEKEISQTDLLSEGGIQKTRFLREAGLYRAVLRSDKPEAEPFIEWVTSEVLPAIRKHGFYMTEKLKEELAEKDIELTRKEAVIQRLQKKKEPRHLVPSEDHLEGFEPPLVSKAESELTPEQISKAKQQHVVKTLNGIITKHIIETTKREKAELLGMLLSAILE